jgi:hypothetical protein
MSIRFSCSNCGQRLSVRAQRAGQIATCPKCKTALKIPAESTPLTNAGRPAITTGNAGGMQFMSLSDEPPSIKVHHPPTPRAVQPTSVPLAAAPTIQSQPITQSVPADSPQAPADYVLLPRYVIFTQGFLLAAVAIVAFLLGFAVNGSRKALPSRSSPVAAGSLQLSGTISLRRQGMRAADVGAALLFIPLDAQPSMKSNLEGFLPDDDSASRIKADAWLKEQGGNFVRCNERGQYEVTLPAAGRFGLLVISGTSTEKTNGSHTTQEREQMGRYFDLSGGQLENLRYQWREETIRTSTNLNIDFD